MKCNFILNMFNHGYLTQIEQMNYFKENCASNMQIETMYILVDEKMKLEKNLVDMNLPAENIVLVKLNSVEFEAETIISTLVDLLKINDSKYVYIFSHDLGQMGVMQRVAWRLNGNSCNEITFFEKNVDNKIILKKMIYANNLQGVFSSEKMPCCCSLSKTFPKNTVKILSNVKENKKIIEKFIDVKNKYKAVKCLKKTFREQKDELSNAKYLVIIGMGVGNKKNADKVKILADRLDAKIAGTRPVIMNAWLPMEKMVGVSGNITAPDICLVLGASGALAFYTGIEKSKYIIAVNKDEAAGIMKKADIIVEDDIEKIISSL